MDIYIYINLYKHTILIVQLYRIIELKAIDIEQIYEKGELMAAGTISTPKGCVGKSTTTMNLGTFIAQTRKAMSVDANP